MVMMEPVSATMKPAPADTFTWRTVMLEIAGRAQLGGVVARSEYWVLAMHTGMLAEAQGLQLRDLLLRRRARTPTPSAW